jgi:hypothetical protein
MIGSGKRRDWLAVLEKPPNWKRLDHSSENAKALCHAMLQFEEKRPDAIECLQHDW